MIGTALLAALATAVTADQPAQAAGCATTAHVYYFTGNSARLIDQPHFRVVWY